MIREMILVRHGRTGTGIIKGRLDIPLAESPETILLWEPEEVFSSPLSRAAQTAEQLFGSFETVDELTNIHRGEFEGRKPEEIPEEKLSAYRADKLNFRPRGGESYADVFRRVGQFLSGLDRNGPESVAIVSHLAVLRAALAWIGVPPETAVHYHFQEGIAVHWKREWGIPSELNTAGIALNRKVKQSLSKGYAEMLHRPVRTSEEACNIRGNRMEEGVKSIIVKHASGFADALVPADRKVRWKPLRKAFGKVSMASPDEVLAATGALPGGVPPVGHGLETFYCQGILKPKVYFNAGLKSSSIVAPGKVLEAVLSSSNARTEAGLC